MMHFSPSRRKASGFTLVEILVVLAIIGLLAALLFPVFHRAKESGYQASCASNLKTIYQAVQLYRQDEKYYPGSLAFLLPSDIDLAGGTANNGNGTGFFKGGRDGLTCPDDDSDVTGIHSSYGDVSVNGPAAGNKDMGIYVWNYYGYRKADGTCSQTDASQCAGTAFLTAADAKTATTTDTSLLLVPGETYDARNNPIKYSLSNRFAPTSTIITHCVFHRLPTANGKIADPFEIYTSANGQGARDIILRLDGTVKTLDVSQFVANGNWQKQNQF